MKWYNPTITATDGHNGTPSVHIVGDILRSVPKHLSPVPTVSMILKLRLIVIYPDRFTTVSILFRLPWRRCGHSFLIVETEVLVFVDLGDDRSDLNSSI